MTIDESGTWWVGTEAGDIVAYLTSYEAEGYPIHDVRLARCPCGSAAFRLFGDRDEQFARHVCIACGAEKFVADSAEHWADATPEQWVCVCGADTCNIGVGFSLHEDRTAIRWLSVGERCAVCGVLGCFVDWKIGHEPSLHFMDEI